MRGRLASLVVFGVLGNACGLPSPDGGAGSAPNRHDVFPEPSGQVDVLFVVDDSPSMIEEQAHIAERLEPFLMEMLRLHSDFHIAVITPDVQAAGVMRTYDGPSVDGCDACRVLTKDVSCTNPDVDTTGLSAQEIDDALVSQCPARLVFRHLVSTGARGAPFEAAFDAAEVALGIPSTQGLLASAETPPPENSTFPRAGGHLALVFVSDEDEGAKSSAPPVSTYLAAFQSLWPDVQAFAVTGYATDASVSLGDACSVLRTTFDADAANDDARAPALLQTLANGTDGCRDVQAPDDINGGAETGSRYIELACRTGGSVENICSYGTTAGARTIAEGAVQLTRAFTLTEAIALVALDCDGDGNTNGPLDKPLCVTATSLASGQRGLVPNDDATGFSYNAATNQVRFVGSFLPALGSDVDVAYRVK